jgi:hypothetical protein
MIGVGGIVYDLSALPPGVRSCSQWIGGWVALIASVDTNKDERNLLSLPETEGQFIGCPACNVVTVLPQLSETKCVQYKSWHADDKVGLISEWFFLKCV